jgi:hypothetical protein
MKRFFIILNGRWRLLFGFCPKCNSDAPEIYDCMICDWYRTSEKGMPSNGVKRQWWNKFIKSL